MLLGHVSAPFPHVRIGLLGLTTIAVYGAWYYAYGVLLDPIIDDTGWSESAMAATFTGGGLLVGAGALAGGWLLDRLGSRTVLLLGAGIGGGAILAASFATAFAQFATLGIIGSGALGGLSFYHVTQTIAVRIAPDRRSKAIARLTIWGALSSPIFLPFAAWLVETYHWRTAVRVLIAPSIVFLLITAAVARTRRPTVPTTRALRTVLSRAWRSPGARRFTIASGLTGMGLSIVLVYQVPVMTSLGLELSVASWIAGFRGFSQLFGRLPLSPIVDRLGARRSTQLALWALFAGFLLLAGSGSVVVAVAFAVVAGFGIGAISPLQGIYTAELFDDDVLGSAMGFVTVLYASVGALGPAIVGALADATGSRLWAAVIGACASGLGALVLIQRRP